MFLNGSEPMKNIKFLYILLIGVSQSACVDVHPDVDFHKTGIASRDEICGTYRNKEHYKEVTYILRVKPDQSFEMSTISNGKIFKSKRGRWDYDDKKINSTGYPEIDLIVVVVKRNGKKISEFTLREVRKRIGDGKILIAGWDDVYEGFWYEKFVESVNKGK